MRTQRDIVVATRIHLPEASAASFRLDAVEKALLGAGVPVRVLTTTAAGKTMRDAPGLRVLRWPVLRDKTGYVRGYIPYMSFDIPLFFRLLFSARPAAVLVEPPPTTGFMVRLAATIRRFPYVWYAADVWSDATQIAGAHPAVVKAVRAMEKFAVAGAAHTIAVSEGVGARVRSLGARRVSVVVNGIDTNTFTVDGGQLSAAERTEHNISDTYFLYAGTASEWQGAEVFAHAIALVRKKYPKAQVAYLGNGSSWSQIGDIAADISSGDASVPPVVQLPQVSAAVAARWQRGAVCSLVSICPGLGYDFAYPTKVLAALACGTPVIYAGTGPVAGDVMNNQLGYHVDYAVSEVAGAMEKMLNNEDDFPPSRLRKWVLENRSLAQTGRMAAKVVLKVARGS
ncbi:MAG: glycosyltransferase [Actinomycetaceae bacterium]|nr:glycosyltransferase [Actinomycetaceae bacterium]